MKTLTARKKMIKREKYQREILKKNNEEKRETFSTKKQKKVKGASEHVNYGNTLTLKM